MDAEVPPLPPVRGTLNAGRPMAELTWLRVGGPADWLFQPADEADLADFLRALPAEVPVLPMGVGSNLIVRDGGIAGVVIRLGRGFNGIAVEGDRVVAGAAALDAHVARRAAEAGVDLTFLRTIPGSIGGAARMNAGCYGSYTADAFVSARAVTRAGAVVTLTPAEMGFAYRSTALPEGMVVTEVTLRGPAGDPADAGGADGGAAGAAGCEPAGEGTLGGVDVSQSGGLLVDRAGRRCARPEGLEADRDGGPEGGDAGWRADVAEAREFPDQHRRGESRRSGEFGRIGAKKGFGINRDHVRVGNHAGRPKIRLADS